MVKLHFSIFIKAPKEKVWKTMLNDATYRQWTEVFSPGSYYVGSWEKGAEIRFLGPNDQGGTDGMVSRIRENKPHEYVSIEHLGIIQNGKEDTSSEATKGWAGAQENYTFKEKDGGTEVIVEIDIGEEHQKMFDDMWPKALQKLKEITEAEKREAVTVQTDVNAPLEKVWECWTEPAHIMQWCQASEDWEAPYAENDLRKTGRFKTTMAAKDKSTSFDFSGTYTKVEPKQRLEYTLDDNRRVTVIFTEVSNGVKITETFEIEDTHAKEIQQAGWQAILDNFKKYTESL